MTILLSLFIALVGCLAYALSSNPKVSELGRIAFMCGLLAFALQANAQSFALFK